MLKRAIAIAKKAHEGQVEKDGGVYLKHPIRLMYMLRHENDLVQMVAILHDVVEDSPITLDDLRREFPIDVVEGVDAVTRRKDETYFEFITRAKKHPIGRKVKMADLQDHLRPGHEKHISKMRIKRYQRALIIMQESSCQV